MIGKVGTVSWDEVCARTDLGDVCTEDATREYRGPLKRIVKDAQGVRLELAWIAFRPKASEEAWQIWQVTNSLFASGTPSASDDGTISCKCIFMTSAVILPNSRPPLSMPVTSTRPSSPSALP